MNTIKLNRNSWHYKLVNLLTSYLDTDHPDICGYRSALLMSFVWILLILICATLTMDVVCDTLIGLSFSLFYGQWMLSVMAQVTIMMAMAIIAGAFSVYMLRWLSTKRTSPKADPGFVRQAFRSWKDKYCSRIEIVD